MLKHLFCFCFLGFLLLFVYIANTIDYFICRVEDEEYDVLHSLATVSIAIHKERDLKSTQKNHCTKYENFN